MTRERFLGSRYHLEFRSREYQLSPEITQTSVINVIMRSRQKPCKLCQQLQPILYRIQYDRSGQWEFVCRSCWDKVQPHNPYYVYGGTWKAKKS